MPLLFSYGTLQQEEVQLATFGRRLDGSLGLLAALADAWRHRGPHDLRAAARRTADQGTLFLTLVGLAVLEPAVELMALGAAQSV